MINKEKIKVLYIVGTARSGSTLLGNILSDERDFINVGELKYIWDRGIIDNWQCTCQYNFNDCLFWKKIINSLSIKNCDLTKILNEFSERGIIKNKRFRIRNLVFNSSKKIKQDISNNVNYLNILNDLYSGIKKQSNSSYILDTSKDAIFSEFLSQIKNIEIYIIHIVREPKSVVYSQVFRRKKQVIDKNRSFLMGTSFWKSIESWYFQNYLIEKLHADKENYFRIKYEDIVAKGDQNKLKEVYNKIEEWGFNESVGFNKLIHFLGILFVLPKIKKLNLLNQLM